MPDAQMIGPYRLERVLGTGSFATVWLAYDDVLDRKVAVKILADNWSRDNDVRRRFLAEARVLLTVESPRIVRGFHLGETPTGQPYLVMAYADRGTLGDRIEQRKREGRTFDARETVGITLEVAYALVDVHTSGHLHRDVKPSNVLVRSSSTRRNIAGLAADEVLVLGDFGLARGLDLSALTLVAGSPGYVAPEQAAGLSQLDRRADLYPIGRMMLEMLTGDPGGRATTMAGAAAETIDVEGLIDDLSHRGIGSPAPPLVSLITRLVAKNADDRPSSADEVAAELNNIARSFAMSDGGGPGRPLTPPSAPPPFGPPGSEGEPQLTGTQLAAVPSRKGGVSLRDRRVIAGAAAVLLAAIAAVVLVLVRGDGDGSGAGTTTAPILVPGSDSSPAVVSDPTTSIGGRPVSTSPDSGSVETSTPASDPVVSDPTVVITTDVNTSSVDTTAGTASTAVETTATESTSTGPVELVVLELPEGTFTGVVGSEPPDLEHQEGSIVRDVEQFAAELVDLNPDWDGEVPAPDENGAIDFEMTGHGRTAVIHIEPAAVTAGDGISAFTIDYE